jgi:AbrB family looped-hinge helix DNA binding protein
MKRVVQRFGGSLVVTIPANVARRLDIHEGDSVEVDEQAGGIVIRPARSLAELVAGWDDLARHLSEADLARGVRAERDARSASL